MPETIREIQTATIRARLPEPIQFGDWVMTHREFALVRVRSENGVDGFGFTATRDGPVASTIARIIADQYLGAVLTTRDDLERSFDRCQGSSLGNLSAGIGLRALSIVDLAAYDLLARSAGVSISRLLGGQASPLPATAIIGYPPGAMDADAVREQVSALREQGWRRFKISIALPLDYARKRALAAREAAGDDCWLGMDAAWVFRSVDEALSFLSSIDSVNLGWFEDVFPPGDAGIVAEFRERARPTPIAMGDEQGGSYFPEALLLRNSVDIVRIDLTCMGGITRAPRMIAACRQAGIDLAPHMFAHVHAPVFAALGLEVPIEWGVPATGVDPYSDSLPQPDIVDGLMKPLPEVPGFGALFNVDWIREQRYDDPDGLIASLN
jgi:L-alanine-DL-glutamate epimerase-like enolase superfamily enzyme